MASEKLGGMHQSMAVDIGFVWILAEMGLIPYFLRSRTRRYILMQ